MTTLTLGHGAAYLDSTLAPKTNFAAHHLAAMQAMARRVRLTAAAGIALRAAMALVPSSALAWIFVTL